MGWMTGVNQAECDGCGYKEIVADRSNAQYWHDEKRIEADGSEDGFLLCGMCHDKYEAHCRKQDESFEVFMKGLAR